MKIKTITEISGDAKLRTNYLIPYFSVFIEEIYYVHFTDKRGACTLKDLIN